MFVVIKLVVFRARFVQSDDKNLPQVVKLMKLSNFRKKTIKYSFQNQFILLSFGNFNGLEEAKT